MNKQQTNNTKTNSMKGARGADRPPAPPPASCFLLAFAFCASPRGGGGARAGGRGGGGARGVPLTGFKGRPV